MTGDWAALSTGSAATEIQPSLLSRTLGTVEPHRNVAGGWQGHQSL